MPRPKRTKITSARADDALSKPTNPAANRSQLQERSTDELNIDATLQRAGHSGRTQVPRDAGSTASRANPSNPSQPSKTTTNLDRNTRAPSTSSSDDFIYHEDPNLPFPDLPPNPAPDRSEAPNDTSTIIGAHARSTKDGGRITGRLHANVVPAVTNMGGFEEFLASSSPRVDRASLNARQSGVGLGMSAVDAGGAERGGAGASVSRPPSAHAPRVGQPTPSFLQMSAFKRRPRQPSLLHMVQQQQQQQHRGQQNRHGAESEASGGDAEDSLSKYLDGPRPPNGIKVEAMHSSAKRKRKASMMAGVGDMAAGMPSSPPALRISASPDGDEGVVEDVHEAVDEDERPEVQVPATQNQEIEIFEDEDADPKPTTSRRRSRQSTASRRSQAASLPQEPSRDRVISSHSPPAAASPEVTPLAEALPTEKPQHHRQGGRPPVRKRNGRMIKPKHAPPTQRSPSPPLSAPSPVSSPFSSAAQQTDHPAPLAAAASAAPAQSRKRVKVTRRRSNGRPNTDAANSTSRNSGRDTEAPQPTVKTANLRTLLPKRKRVIQPQTDTFDLPSSSPTGTSSEAENNSELRQPKAKARPAKRQPLKAKSVNARIVPRSGGEGKDKTKRTAHNSRAQAQKTRPKDTAVASKQGKTYARWTREPTVDLEADQEREEADADAPAGDDEAETTVYEASKSRDLASAAKHFKEVDDWEMSFESCDVAGGSSSPWR